MPWRRSKKLSHPRGGSPPELAPGTPIEVWCQDEMRVGQKKTHLSLGQERLTSSRHSRSTHPIDLPVRCCLPRARDWRRPRAAGLQQRSHAAPSRRNCNQGHPRCARCRAPRSSWLAWRQGSHGPKQYVAHAAAAARTRTQRPGKHLADRMFVVGAYVARPRYATSEGCVG